MKIKDLNIEQLTALHSEYINGTSLVDLAKRFNQKHETLAGYFKLYNLPIKTKQQRYSDSVKNYKISCVKKYGVGNPNQTKELKDKKEKIYLVRYGVSNPNKLESVKQKKKETLMRNYGVDSYAKTDEFKKICPSPFKNKKLREKIKNKWVEKYGVDNPSKLDYVKDKKIKTCLKNYGVTNPSKNLSIALKSARNSRKAYIKYHWKTHKELICIASFEAKTVDWLNKNKIEYEWQKKFFQTPYGCYLPDLYLTDFDKWIEIKGYFRSLNSKSKWEYFKSVYPNSELWNKDKLKEKGIL